MTIRGDEIRIGAVRRWGARLLLLAFVLRALVPVGFMPDFSASANGTFKVVICSTMGAKTITLDDNGKPVPGESSGQHAEPCAFSGMTAVALPAIDAASIIGPDFAVSPSILHLAVSLPPTRAGPPVGSRGPPQLS